MLFGIRFDEADKIFCMTAESNSGKEFARRIDAFLESEGFVLAPRALRPETVTESIEIVNERRTQPPVAGAVPNNNNPKPSRVVGSMSTLEYLIMWAKQLVLNTDNLPVLHKDNVYEWAIAACKTKQGIIETFLLEEIIRIAREHVLCWYYIDQENRTYGASQLPPSSRPDNKAWSTIYYSSLRNTMRNMAQRPGWTCTHPLPRLA